LVPHSTREAEGPNSLTAAAKREFDVLVFWSLDRLTREGALATLRYLETLTSYGVGYRSFTETYLDSIEPFRDAIVAILGCIARQERQRISERVLAGLARAKREGRIGGRPKVIVSSGKIRKLADQRLWDPICTALTRRFIAN
jgi:DNA invertase Pin-like site-specific DNA recombinase